MGGKWEQETLLLKFTELMQEVSFRCSNDTCILMNILNFEGGPKVLDFISGNEYQKLRFKVENLGVSLWNT